MGALLGAVAALALASPPPASAAPRTIAEFGSGAGRVWNPKGVAVDQSTGDLYVADRNNFRIDRFGPAGDFLLAWGWGVADGKSQELQVCGTAAAPPTKRCFEAVREGSQVASGPGAVAPAAVAVEQSSGDVYVAGQSRVSKFTPDGALLYMVGRNVNETKAKEEGPGAPYSQAEKNICTAADLAAGDVCGAGLSGTGPGEFASPASLAIDSEDKLWVGDTNRIKSFGSSGVAGAEIALPGAGATLSLALDSAGDFYVKSASLEGIRKLQAGTGALLETLDAAGQPLTVTLDEADNVYVGDSTSPYRFKVYDPAGEQVSQFGAGQVIGKPGGFGGGNALAVGESAESLYVAGPTVSDVDNAVQAFAIPEPGPLPSDQHVEELEPSSATLAATLNPEGHETTYRFEYDTSPYGEGEAGHGTAVPAPDAILPGSEYEDEEVGAALEGLIPSTTYHFRLAATSHCKAAEPAVECTVYGEDTIFATRTAVGIEAQWSSDVAARSATLHAELDPLGVKGEWWLEYDTSPYGEGEAGHGSQSAKSALPASFGAIPVAVPLTGLDPATAYHYRFVAEDEREGETYEVAGEDRAFATQLAGLGFALPDSRAWEMVSPPEKHGGRIAAPNGAQGGQVQAAANGEALAYLSYGSLEPNPEGNRLIEQSSELAKRAPGGAWSTRDITPPHTTVTPFKAGTGAEYKLFDTNLGSALLEPRECTPLSPAASERTPYLRENTEPPAYAPLVTAKEGFANVPAGTLPFGGDCAGLFGAVSVSGASADLGHVVLGSSVPLAAGAAPGSLYEWSGGALSPLSVLPGAEDAVGATLGSGKASVRGAVSEDGSRVFWTSSGGLYLRDTAREETLRLDEVKPGGFGTGKVAPLFQVASADGSVAFFTDTQSLTEDANEEGADLYRCEMVVEAGELKCDLADLTSQVANFGESAAVQGLLPGIAADGSSAYFLARGVLDTEPGGEGESASSGQPNLYAWQLGEGVRFVATLAGADSKDWGGGGDGTEAYKLTAAASPSGRYLAFMSERPLSGYDNRDATSGERVQEVFRYDAQTDEFACVSCNPPGARPRALVPGPAAGELSEEFDPNQLWNGEAVAALLPEATRVEVSGASLYRPRYVHDDGRVFFNAADSLVAADSNGDGDVYEYEPTGVGTCTATSGGAGTAVVPGGCVSLISSGTAEGTSAFLDASESGKDVFFYSPARLSVTDVDGELDVYDAREGGEPAVLSPSAECLGEACQPPASPPEAQTPASAAFRGPGNPSPRATPRRCPKGKRRVRRKGTARCVEKRHESRHPKHRRGHERANRGGRAVR